MLIFAWLAESAPNPDEANIKRRAALKYWYIDKVKFLDLDITKIAPEDLENYIWEEYQENYFCDFDDAKLTMDLINKLKHLSREHYLIATGQK